MANKKISGITVKIGGDATELGDVLKSVESTSKNLRSELREVNYSIKSNGDSVVLWEQKQELLSKAIEESREKVKILEEAQRDVNKQLENKAITGEQYRAFQRELENARTEAKRFDGQLEETENKIKDLNGAADKSSDSIENLGDELAEVDKSLKKNKDSVVLWEQKQQLLSKAFDNSKEKLNMLENAQRDVNKQLENKAITGEQYRAFQREVEDARAETKYFGNQLEEAENKVKELRGTADKTAESAQNLGDDLHDAGEQAEKSSDGYSVLKGALADLVVDGIKAAADAFKNCTEQAMEFETSIAKVNTIADGSVSIEKMEEDIMNLSNTTGIAAGDISNAVYDAISAGQDTADAVGFVEKSTELARAGFADTGDALDLLTTILNAYGLESEKVTEVSDILIQTQNLGKTTVGELSSAMGKVIPTANSCGISLEQLAAAYAVMTSNGVATAETTTYINSMLNELSKSGTKSSDTLKNETGKSFQELVDSGESLSDILSHIKDAADKQNMSFNDMWGSAEAGKAGLILLGDSAADYNSVLDQMKNSSGATETALGKLNTSSHELEIVQNKLKNTSIKAGKEILASLTPLVEKALPKVESMIDVFNKNLPKAIDTGKKLIPVAKGVGAAFAAWKLGQAAKSLGDFNGKMKDSGGWIKNITGLISGNPFGTLAAGAGIAATAIDYFSDKVKVGKSEVEKLVEKQEAYQKAARDSIDEIENLRKEADENAIKINIEYDDIQKKWEELQTLVDQNGKIKEGYEARVNYIVNELTEATGIEIELVDGQIRKYSELKATIEKTIEKQRAQRLFSVYSEQEADYIQKREEAKEEVDNQRLVVDDAWKKYQEANSKVSLLEKGYVIDGEQDLGVLKAKRDKAKAAYDAEKASLDAWEEDYLAADSKVDWLMKAENLIAEEEYSKATRLLTAHNDEYKRVAEDKNKTDEERREAYKSSLDKMNSDLDLANRSAEKGYKDSAKKQVQTIADTLAENVDIALESGVKSAAVFDENFKSTFKRLLQNGADVSAIGDILKKHGITWGNATGLTIEEQVELAIKGKGPSMADAVGSLVHGAVDTINADPPVVTVAVKPEFWELNEFLSGFDSGFSGFVGKLTSNIPMFASGGFLPSGQGIVAEAGPELIEIMNGGAKITPLTGNARNTAVSGADGNRNKVVYINNTINASVSGSYDVRRLAEDLASEQRRIERNMGL